MPADSRRDLIRSLKALYSDYGEPLPEMSVNHLQAFFPFNPSNINVPLPNLLIPKSE
jgi:hypothetical protein